MNKPEFALVGDVGATNLRLGVASDGGLLESTIVPTPDDADEFFRVIGKTTKSYMADYEISAGSIGFPGPVRIINDGIEVGPITNIPALDEVFDVNERVAAESKELNGFSILALNDAEAATHAAPDVLDSTNRQGVISYFGHGTGIGGDSIHEGVICSRADGMLSEYGHLPLIQTDGSYETLESLVSGSAIARKFGTGIYDSRHEWADRIWSNIGKDFGRGIASLTPIIGMGAVVIGGGVSRYHSRYAVALGEELAKAVDIIPNGVVEKPPIVEYVPENLIDDIGLVGAFKAVQLRYKELA